MQSRSEISKACPVCGEGDIYLKYTTHDRHYGLHDKNFDVFCCRSCGLLFLNPMIEDEALISLYPSDSYYSYRPFSKDRSLKKRIMKQVMCNIVHEEFIVNSIKGKKLLDVGCGSGEKLFEYKTLGADVKGVEIDKNAAELGLANSLDITQGTIFDANYNSDYFDIIRCNHSFEHFTEPKRYLEEIKRILKPEGILYLGLPNTASFQYRVFQKYWNFIGVPFHPFSYNPKNIRYLLEENGFYVKKVYFNANAYGVTGSLQILLNRKNWKTSKQGIMTHFLPRLIGAQVARITNWLNAGDRMEVIAIRK